MPLPDPLIETWREPSFKGKVRCRAPGCHYVSEVWPADTAGELDRLLRALYARHVEICHADPNPN